MTGFVPEETLTAEVCHVLNEYNVLLCIANPSKSMSQPGKAKQHNKNKPKPNYMTRFWLKERTEKQ